jgi:hypothetical protein
VGPSAEALIAGFVLAGEGGTRLLLRGVGPGLRPFGVPGFLADPRLDLYRDTTLEDSNDDWPLLPARLQMLAVANRVQAFVFPDDSRDATLLTWLSPTRYTAHLSAPTGERGIALLELYDSR